MRRNEGVRNTRYKLIRFYGKDVPGGEEWELYDLENDPSEMKNLYGDKNYAKIEKSLKAELQKLRKKYKVDKVSL